MKKTGILSLLFIMVLSQGFSQQTISPAGNTHQSESLSISWTLGELAIETIRQEDVILTQGLHQPVITVTIVEDCPGCSYDLLLYPNPATEHVILSTDHHNVASLYYRIFNVAGVVVQSERIHSSRQLINLSSFAPGLYLMSVYDDNALVKTFKVLKK